MFGLGPPTSSFIQTNLLITLRKPCPGVFIVTGHHHCDSSLGSVVDLGHYFLHYAVVAMGGGVKGRLDRILITNGGSSLSLLQYRERHQY